MSTSSVLLENAVDQLATLPGIGRRTAMRMALDLLRRDVAAVQRFSEAVRRLREEVRYCAECCNISDQPVCGICASPSRDRGVVCVVEDIRDVVAIENTHQFKGLYHVLGGVISPMDGVGPDDLQVARLLERVDSGSVREVVLALGATLEGDTTCFYLNRRLQERGITVSQIARGISVGGDLEHVDELTLGRSIMDRKPYEQGVKR
ncbi:MAG: recombination protein RecR [Flavobacteriales bacterium]|nr:recombination protein RecR [Flavobacteriales bacterium]MBK7941829.1 recombination protein RecR [Flavobacteriales bacterium]MBK8947636.1 recombination protein RecR [Flavobacteriales bacterium]MBK9700372.1 recombination protein RecR [Flavobacteriales bacterium]